jgi:endonuclease/exonuclease/phosphatase family metal-dependent hydrolase
VVVVAFAIHRRAPGPPPPHPGKGVLRIVTYNIRAGLGGLDRVAEDLAPLRADVVALQEAERGIPRSRSVDQPGELAEALGMEAVFASSFRIGGGGHGLAILSPHPISDVRTHSLPQGSGRWPRVALTARIDAPTGPFRMVCVHLARPRGWPLSNTATRVAQLDALLEALQDETLPVVLAGDFNCLPIALEGLSIARHFAGAWNPWRDGWATSFSLKSVGFPGGSVKIDHVYHERSWKSHGTWVAPPGASDHRAVIADVVPGWHELLPASRRAR